MYRASNMCFNMCASPASWRRIVLGEAHCIKVGSLFNHMDLIYYKVYVFSLVRWWRMVLDAAHCIKVGAPGEHRSLLRFGSLFNHWPHQFPGGPDPHGSACFPVRNARWGESA